MPRSFDTSAAYESAFARAPIGMALVGLDAHFREVNAAFCAIAGRSREELVGQPYDIVTHPDDVDADVALATEIVRGDRDVFRRVKRHVRPDGSLRWVEINVALIRDDQGTPLHFVSHVQDITERRAAEEAELSERVRIDRLKNEFLATISHELRTPLTSIQGYADLLADIDDLPASARRTAVAAIERNATRLRALVDDVQFVAQARAETLSLDRIEPAVESAPI
jgi:PAS domain S-box-containing protein